MLSFVKDTVLNVIRKKKYVMFTGVDLCKYWMITRGNINILDGLSLKSMTLAAIHFILIICCCPFGEKIYHHIFTVYFIDLYDIL